MGLQALPPEEIIAKLREADVLPGQGKKVPEVVKAIGISEVSHYCCGMSTTTCDRTAQSADVCRHRR